MAESFVNPFERGYVSRIELADAQAVLARPLTTFEYFNVVRPHSSLKMRAPNEFSQHLQQAA